jgi:hypothetical protein
MARSDDNVVVMLDAWMACPKLDYPADEDGQPVLNEHGLPELDSSLYARGGFVRRGTILSMIRHWYFRSKSRNAAKRRLLSGLRRTVLSQHVYDGETWLPIPQEMYLVSPVTTKEQEELIRSCQ